MLTPVFNKESAADELMRLYMMLNEAHEHCKDNNFTWRIVQLANQAEELYTGLLSAYELAETALSKEYTTMFENIAANHTKAAEVFLSLAFSAAAGLDMAHYEGITLPEDFKMKLHGLSRTVLSLLHEYRDEAAQE